MGADLFITRVTGYSAQEAFNAAVEQAAYDHGHAGYTGTIAEKSSFVMIPFPSGDQRTISVKDEVEKLIDAQDPRIDDKWGPAGCFDLGPVDDGKRHQYVFFGWASS